MVDWCLWLCSWVTWLNVSSFRFSSWLVPFKLFSFSSFDFRRFGWLCSKEWLYLFTVTYLNRSRPSNENLQKDTVWILRNRLVHTSWLRSCFSSNDVSVSLFCSWVFWPNDSSFGCSSWLLPFKLFSWSMVAFRRLFEFRLQWSVSPFMATCRMNKDPLMKSFQKTPFGF